MSHSIRRLAQSLFLLVAASLAVLPSSDAVAQSEDVTLASTNAAKITIADYEASILRIPERDRFGWAMSQERIVKEIENLLQTRAVANEARKLGLESNPVLKTRLALYADRLLMEAAVARVDAESAKEFEKRRAVYVDRAREQYLVNKEKYRIGAQVKASHILITTNGRTAEEALAKIKSLREKIVAGASFEELALANSEDASVKSNKGDLGFFTSGQMDPAFEAAAFAMQKRGELSEPVKSRFGYHLIRFDDRKEARPISFEEALPDLLEKLKSDFIDTQRAQAFKSTFDSAKVQWNEPAVMGLRKHVDPALLKSLTQ